MNQISRLNDASSVSSTTRLQAQPFVNSIVEFVYAVAWEPLARSLASGLRRQHDWRIGVAVTGVGGFPTDPYEGTDVAQSSTHDRRSGHPAIGSSDAA